MHAIGPATDNGKTLQYRLNSYMSGPISTCGIDSIAASENVDVASRSLNARASGRWITFFSIAILRTLARLKCHPPLTGMSCLNPTEKLPDVMLLLPLPRIFRTPRRKFTALGAHRRKLQGNLPRALKYFQSLQATTDSLFYLEKGTKDAKLGKPLGIIAACTNECPDSVEAPYSGMSLQKIITNMKGFTEMFSSNAETGFDAHLENEGWPEVSQAFKSNLAKAKELAESIDSSVASQVAAIQTEADETECTNAFSNPDTVSESLPMCTLYGLVKRVVDSLKIDFVTIVNVDIPGGSQSDND